MPSPDRASSSALEVVGDPDHLVGVGAGAGQDDGGLAVLAQRGAGLRGDDVGDAGLVLEEGGDLGEDVLAGVPR